MLVVSIHLKTSSCIDRSSGTELGAALQDIWHAYSLKSSVITMIGILSAEKERKISVPQTKQRSCEHCILLPALFTTEIVSNWSTCSVLFCFSSTVNMRRAIWIECHLRKFYLYPLVQKERYWIIFLFILLNRKHKPCSSRLIHHPF